MKTYVPTAAEVKPRWHVIDADGKVLGRLAARVATLLRGKHKPTYQPHMDTGDFVIVVNAAGVRLTGRKRHQKELIRHSGFPGGLKRIPYDVLLKTHPERVITEAVRGMLPKTRQGRMLVKKLKVYRGAQHPHQAQQPTVLEL
ncbi:MAG: 50S ribosomal protein L13 [Armatimonadota bacterium]|nr:50S ribosomal protein L13 [Armatimonadota bacterium]